MMTFPLGDSTRDRYVGIKRIGAGTFADIWKVHDQYDPERKQWAMKVVKAGNRKVDHRKAAKYESAMVREGMFIRRLNKLDWAGSAPIIRCKELLYAMRANPVTMRSPSPSMGPCLVLELMGFSLLQYIEICERKQVAVSLRTVRSIAVQLFAAMSFLHGKGGYVHADLKPENVMISWKDSVDGNLMTNEHPKIKVVDFGNAMPYRSSTQTFAVQTLFYRAPEVLFGNEISAAIDMWSIGCILVELININEFNRHRFWPKTKAQSDGASHSRRRPTTKWTRRPLFGCIGTAELAQKMHSVLSPFPETVYNEFYSFYFKEMAAVFRPRTMTHCNTSYTATKAMRTRKLTERLSIREDAAEYVQCIDLIAGLLDLDPATRYSSEDAIQHRFCIDRQYLEPELVELLSSTFDSAYPEISISSDQHRQSRMNQEVNTYRYLKAVAQRDPAAAHVPRKRALIQREAAFIHAYPAVQRGNGPRHNRAICAVKGCCQRIPTPPRMRVGDGREGEKEQVALRENTCFHQIIYSFLII